MKKTAKEKVVAPRAVPGKSRTHGESRTWCYDGQERRYRQVKEVLDATKKISI